MLRVDDVLKKLVPHMLSIQNIVNSIMLAIMLDMANDHGTEDYSQDFVHTATVNIVRILWNGRRVAYSRSRSSLNIFSFESSTHQDSLLTVLVCCWGCCIIFWSPHPGQYQWTTAHRDVFWKLLAKEVCVLFEQS
jgi:hypothetical protein